jgi:hypothetical protein
MPDPLLLPDQPVPLQACVFGKALLSGCACCELAVRRSVGERETVSCPSPPARINCSTLDELIYERATFALRLPRSGTPIPHIQRLRMHCAGLSGLQAAYVEETERTLKVSRGETALGSVPDAHRLIQHFLKGARSLTDLPWQDIVARISAWQTRRRASARPHETDEAN